MLLHPSKFNPATDEYSCNDEATLRAAEDRVRSWPGHGSWEDGSACFCLGNGSRLGCREESRDTSHFCLASMSSIRIVLFQCGPDILAYWHGIDCG